MPIPYPLSAINNFSFEFVTEQGIQYVAYFIEYGFMFKNYPDFANNTYTFNLDVAAGDADEALSDERIGVTIVEVFKLFFKKVENVIIYVCDSTDKRHLARKRKFDLWFWKYNDGSIVKEDGVAVIEDVEIYNSIMLNKSHPHLTAVIFAFKELNEKADEK